MEKSEKRRASASQKDEGEALQHLGREIHAARIQLASATLPTI